MGGGRQNFLPTWENDIEGKPGKRTDGLNLIKVWENQHRKDGASYVQTKEQLLNVRESIQYFCVPTKLFINYFK